MSESHQFYMLEALKIALKGRLTAPPNPWVGAVVVKNGYIIGRGFHHSPGSPHAEVEALKEAGLDAEGATLYVTLEPCSHTGRTPPCVDAIIKAKISTVVIPFLDPDHRVSGSGVRKLEEAGIKVIIGVEEERAKKNLAPYLKQRKTGLPYIIIKAASSLDGRIAAQDGTSQWITSEKTRYNVHKLRAESQAVLIGSNTLNKDLPRLTVRGLDEEFNQPIRAVCTTKNFIVLPDSLWDIALAPTMIFSSKENSLKNKSELQAAGIQVVEVAQEALGKLNLHEVIKRLGELNILQLMVEGGSLIQTSLIQEELFDQLTLYYGNCLLGSQGKSLFELPIESIVNAKRFNLSSFKQFDNDFRCDYIK